MVVIIPNCETIIVSDEDKESMDGYYWEPDSIQAEESYYGYYGKLPSKYEVCIQAGSYKKKIKGDSLTFLFQDSILLKDSTAIDIEIYIKYQSIYGTVEINIGSYGYLMGINNKAEYLIKDKIIHKGFLKIKTEIKR